MHIERVGVEMESNDINLARRSTKPSTILEDKVPKTNTMAISLRRRVEDITYPMGIIHPKDVQIRYQNIIKHPIVRKYST